MPDIPNRCRLVNLVGRLGVKDFGHEGDIIGRGDRLAFADRNRLVVIGLATCLLREVFMARNCPECFQDARVLDPSLDQVA